MKLLSCALLLLLAAVVSVECAESPPPCRGDWNATLASCPNTCPPTCSDPKRQDVCPCRGSGCQCIKGYVLNKTNNKCIKPQDCPRGCRGDPNAYVTTASCDACPLTCENGGVRPKPCISGICRNYPCVCFDGYVLNTKNNRCVRLSACPGKD